MLVFFNCLKTRMQWGFGLNFAGWTLAWVDFTLVHIWGAMGTDRCQQVILCHNGPCRRSQLCWVACFVLGMGKSHVCAPWSRVPACGLWVLSGIAPAVVPFGREYQRVGEGLCGAAIADRAGWARDLEPQCRRRFDKFGIKAVFGCSKWCSSRR